MARVKVALEKVEHIKVYCCLFSLQYRTRTRIFHLSSILASFIVPWSKNLLKMRTIEENNIFPEVDSGTIYTEATPLIHTDNRTDVEDLGDMKFLLSMDESEIKENAQKCFCPHGIKTHMIPLLLVLIATSFTYAGSWDCSYFHGASTGFTGNNYGLWTLEGMDGTCQPWDILFFTYSLGPYLKAARVLSMTSMMLGLSLLTAMSQALQCHVVSWGVGLGLFALFITALATAPRYNVWTVFFFFLYVVLVLIVRSLFIHPVHRAISERGSKYIAWLLILNFVLTIITLLVLNSDFCQCNRLTNEKLEARLDPSLDPCDTTCKLGPAGVTSILGAIAWLLAGLAVFKFGVQPEDFETRESARFGGYRQQSITTRFLESLAEAKKQAADLRKIMTMKRNEDLQKLLDDDDDDDNGNYFQRTCCQKLCCDFRVTERTKKEKTLFWCFRFALVALYTVFAIAVVLLIGSRNENGKAERSPSTSPNFITNVTCAFNPLDPSAPFVTYMTPEAAKKDGMVVAHCGPCAYCSNIDDIKTYLMTRSFITIQAKKCGKTAVLGSTEELDDCLKNRIGFTSDCRTCWVANMQCDTKRCLFICMKTLFTGLMRRNNVPQAGAEGRLNWCLQCDEQRCGTAFATCSGVARRRLGIRSDIERNPAEICPHVEIDWLSYPFE